MTLKHVGFLSVPYIPLSLKNVDPHPSLTPSLLPSHSAFKDLPASRAAVDASLGVARWFAAECVRLFDFAHTLGVLAVLHE